MERRQEIGILKSMGALAGDVFKLVWLETVILCISGGLIGTGLALVTARLTDILVRNLLPYSPSGGLVAIDVGLVLVTLGVVTAVGLASGVYPSWKAARMRPLDTIRSEEQS
jgi:putative ABC transport system permease protein